MHWNEQEGNQKRENNKKMEPDGDKSCAQEKKAYSSALQKERMYAYVCVCIIYGRKIHFSVCFF